MNSNNTRIFSKRIFILLIAKIILFLVLVGRLFYLQIKENFYFYNLSEKNRTNLIPIVPKRGLIVDNFNIIIADNVFLWEILFIKSNINQSIDLFLNTLSSIIKISNEEKDRIKKDYNKNPAYYPILVKQNISQSEIAAVETFSYNLPGVFIRPFYRRNYPMKEEMAHILGYTAISDDLEKNNNITGWHVGKSAIELAMDNFLKGEVGYAKYEINSRGEAIRKLDQTPSKQGHQIAVTIDSVLQNKVYSLLSQYYSGSAIVTDLTNGNILALASYPSFDPNLFSQGIPDDVWKSLRNSPYAPLTNKVINGLYPPGSTIKPIIALQALQDGLLTQNTHVECNGYINVGKDRFHCWKKEGHGKLNLEQALTQSCDVFFYELTKKISASQISTAASNFGFKSKKLGIIDNESVGRLPNDQKNYKPTLGDIIVSSIGQGTWIATPIQLAHMISTIANNGNQPTFNLIKNIEYDNKIIYPKNSTNKPRLNYSKEYFDLVNRSLFNTVNSPLGTGKLASTYDPKWAMAGKTGTSQVRRITRAERDTTGVLSNYDLPWEKRDHSLFIGYVPYNKPLYAITVVVEHGGGGGITTAPIAREIALTLKERTPLYEKEKEAIRRIIGSTAS